MNPSFERNIADLQLIRSSGEVQERANGDALAVLTTLVKQIQGVKLSRKRDNRGERTAWLECADKTVLLDDLAPSNGQRQFLESEELRVRVMSARDEGPTARNLDLFTIDPETKHPVGHLMGVLALGPKDTQDETYILYPSGFGLILPGSAEFDDVQAVISNFVPVSS